MTIYSLSPAQYFLLLGKNKQINKHIALYELTASCTPYLSDLL